MLGHAVAAVGPRSVSRRGGRGRQARRSATRSSSPGPPIASATRATGSPSTTNMANIATSSPEVLIAHIAAVTERIRVGAGGIMIPEPHAAARRRDLPPRSRRCTPGRIDLGLGRAPGTDPVTSAALRRVRRSGGQSPARGAFRVRARRVPRTGTRFRSITPDCRPTCAWGRSGCSVRRSRARRSLRSSACRMRFAGHFAMRPRA